MHAARRHLLESFDQRARHCFKQIYHESRFSLMPFANQRSSAMRVKNSSSYLSQVHYQTEEALAPMCVFRCKLRLSHTQHRCLSNCTFIRLSATLPSWILPRREPASELVVKRKRAIALFLLSVLNSAVSLAAAFGVWAVESKELRNSVGESPGRIPPCPLRNI
jgi:hypothetical protein